jgi:hypothetical protein
MHQPTASLISIQQEHFLLFRLFSNVHSGGYLPHGLILQVIEVAAVKNGSEWKQVKSYQEVCAMNQLESSLPLPQRGEERMNQERRWFDGSSNSYPITYQQPNTDWYSLDISYKYE